MSKFESKRQGDLFQGNELLKNSYDLPKEFSLNQKSIKAWQSKIASYQANIFYRQSPSEKQFSLFKTTDQASIDNFDPLKLTPLPLSFWRWPKPPHHGQAIYLVMDRPDHIKGPLLLYVGETISADKRWKGPHDCKTYLESYTSAHTKANLKTNLSIRFWTDVPSSAKPRRRLEQELIKLWLPPFNKETRGRWGTPFTS